MSNHSWQLRRSGKVSYKISDDYLDRSWQDVAGNQVQDFEE
ncbi:hypothetical protein QY887_03200 [Latilactobacillus sakei]